jgi:ubiquinone/menaquinone biosynthesis C-methylase UbiE
MKESTKQNWETFWEEKSDLEVVYANSDRIRRNLVKFMDLRGARILEVGAGTGRDSAYMMNDGAELHLLDYSKNSLSLICKALPVSSRVNPVGADAFRAPFRDETFDVVFHQGLLEHFRPVEARALLKENIRILKTGGILLVDVPQRWHVYTLVKHVLIAMNAWFAGWEREFSVRELRGELTSLGMRFVHAYGEWMYPSFFYRTIREILLKLGIRLPLRPRLTRSTARFRAAMRRKCDGSWLQRSTALSIGVLMRKDPVGG